MIPLVALPLLFVACTSGPVGPPDASDVPTGGTAAPDALVLQPDMTRLLPQDTVRFSALFQDLRGRVVIDTVVWEASGGSISDGGLFVAGLAHGTYKVVAKRKNGRKKGKRMADTAVVIIDSVAPAEPAGIRISPAQTSLGEGEAVQFTADVTDADGQPIDVTVTWQATGGVVAGSGRYTAGPDAGQFIVAARTENGLADTARVTILVQENQPPNASFTYSCGDLRCDFDGSGSSDPDGTLASFAWEFGDGSQSSSSTVQHTFSESGTYVVVLTVTDDGGAHDTRNRTISVSEALDGIPIHPGESIQAAVDANPAGSAFVIMSGTHRRQQVTPKNYMSFVGEAGAILDGEGQTDYAFGGYGIPGHTVTVRGLIIENYAPQELYQGAIQGDNTAGWLVEDNEVRNNQGVGIRLGPDMRAVGNAVHGNSNVGIGGFNPHGAVIEDNEIYGNGFAGRSGEHAGLKIVAGRDIVLRGNYSHDNEGRGLWLDTDIFDAVVEGNVVRDNTTEGIWLEVVCGAVIRDNLAERNGLSGSANPTWPDKAGIQVVNGTDVEVYNNTLNGNLNGIAVIAASGYPVHECVPDLRNVYVHDNTVDMESGASGLVQNYGDKSYFDSRNNRFEANTYYLGNEAQYFVWDDRRMTEAEWRAAGQDVTGNFHR